MNQEQIPTATDYLSQQTNANLGITKVHKRTSSGDVHHSDIIPIMIEFAQLHVQAALKEASENALINEIPYRVATEEQKTLAQNCNEYGIIEIDKNSIINAYPLDLII